MVIIILVPTGDPIFFSSYIFWLLTACALIVTHQILFIQLVLRLFTKDCFKNIIIICSTCVVKYDYWQNKINSPTWSPKGSTGVQYFETQGDAHNFYYTLALLQTYVIADITVRIITDISRTIYVLYILYEGTYWPVKSIAVVSSLWSTYPENFTLQLKRFI